MFELSENGVFGFARVHGVEVARLGVRASESVFRDHAGLDGGSKSVLSVLDRNNKLLLAGLILTPNVGDGLSIQAQGAVLAARSSLLHHELVGSLPGTVMPDVHVSFLGLS